MSVDIESLWKVYSIESLQRLDSNREPPATTVNNATDTLLLESVT